MGGGGWIDQVELKLTQSPAEAGVEVGTELGKSVKQHLQLRFYSLKPVFLHSLVHLFTVCEPLCFLGYPYSFRI